MKAKTIELSSAELTTGIFHERLLSEAQTMLDERRRAHAIFVAYLRLIHDVPESQYDLDWVRGFIEKPTGEANG